MATIEKDYQKEKKSNRKTNGTKNYFIAIWRVEKKTTINAPVRVRRKKRTTRDIIKIIYAKLTRYLCL